MQILDIGNIHTLSIKVTEKIEKRNLLKFIRTTIFNSELSFSKNSYFYFHYLSSSSTYEIILYDKSSSDIMLEPFLLLNNNVIEKDVVFVYITENYFLVSKNNNPMILKEISDTSQGDITIYLEQIYKINDYKLIYLNKEEIINIKEVENNLVKYKEYSLFPEKSFIVFSIFLLCSSILLIFSIFMVYHSDNNIKTISPTTVKEKIVINHPRPIDKTVEIFDQITKYDIHINQIS
ncbi:hypothetical protein N9818_01050, partial [Arcobacteraceae bacterium]|nr:hypothetical protein [Arcobacteraceae bacterium]